MKVVEPVSSALLITACVYSAGVSQNNAFLRSFKLSPEFSQPAIDKILYDGGLILYELLWSGVLRVASYIATHPISLLISLIILFFAIRKIFGTWPLAIKRIVTAVSNLSSIGFIGLLVALSFFSYEKGQVDGAKIAAIYLSKCYEVRISSDDKTSTGCAFRKDKDSIWYYKIDDTFKVYSETLTETSKIEYLPPRLVMPDGRIENQIFRPIMK